MRFRKLRIAWSVAWGIACVLLIVLWVRSLNRIDCLTWHYNNAEALLVRTNPGIVTVATFVDRPAPSSVVRQVGRAWMTGWFESMMIRGGKMSWWFEAASTSTFRSASAPDWFLILICCGLGSIPWLRWRFTLRTLLIATTLVAAVLGLIVWLTHH
jgi:hypothetical protein